MSTLPSSTHGNVAPKKANKTRKTKTAADLKIDLESARKKIAALEQRAYAAELETEVKSLRLPELIIKIKQSVKGVTDLAIMAALAKASGFKRLEITQKPQTARNPKAAK